MPWASGSSASSPTSTLSITISPVIEARKDSFPPIFGADSPVMPFSKMKPSTLPSCASDLAQTTKTSAIGLSEIHIFEPIRR